MPIADPSSQHADHVLKLRFNRAFLPEFVSTVLLSLPVSGMFLIVAIIQAGAPGDGLHWLIAIISYLAMAAGLLTWTIAVRVRCRHVILSAGENERAVLKSGSRVIELDTLVGISERLERFFGRRTRVLRLEDNRGDSWEVNEVLEGYEGLKQALTSITGLAVEVAPGTDRGELRDTAVQWALRHRALPYPRGFFAVVGRMCWRTACLVPVALSDVMVNTAFFLLFFNPRPGGSNMMMYSLPASLVVSALIARYGYYYLFTNASPAAARRPGAARALRPTAGWATRRPGTP